jgi:hypothetical protein
MNCRVIAMCAALVWFCSGCQKQAPAGQPNAGEPAREAPAAGPISPEAAVPAVAPAAPSEVQAQATDIASLPLPEPAAAEVLPQAAGAVALVMVTAQATPFLRKAKVATDTVHPLHYGHLVELLPGEGTKVDKGGQERYLKHARFGGLEGYVFADDVREVEESYPGGKALWEKLVKLSSTTVPGGCQPIRMVADVMASPGNEVVVYGVGEPDCLRPLGIFDASGRTLLFSRFDRTVWEVAVHPQPSGPGVLELALKSTDDSGTEGGSDRLFHFDRDGAGLELALELVESRFSLASDKSIYVMTDFKHHKHDGRWLIQYQSTERVVQNFKDHDRSRESFYEFTGTGFKEVAAPAGVAPLPRPEPTIVTGGAPVKSGE